MARISAPFFFTASNGGYEQVFGEGPWITGMPKIQEQFSPFG